MSTNLIDLKAQKEIWLALYNSRKSNDDLAPENFYCESISPKIAKKLRADNPNIADKYKSLIALLGFTPETVVLSCLLFKPENLLILHNKESSRYLDLVYRHCGLPLSKFHHVEVDCSSIESMAAYFNASLELLPGINDAIVEVTSGEKSLSIAVAMAAAIKNLDICFLSYDKYISPTMRKPDPEAFKLSYIENPAGSFIDILGGPEIERAVNLFNIGEYHTAALLFQGLQDRLSETRTAEFMKLLSKAYHKWDRFDFAKAIPLMEEAVTLAGMFEGTLKRKISFDFRNLEKQLSALKKLAKHHQDTMLLNCYFASIREEQRDRHDIAALLYYRALEMCFCIRLQNLFPHFKTDEPDYSLLGMETGELLRKFNEIGQDISKKFNKSSLPEKAALTDIMILLKALEDPMMKQVHLGFVKHVIKLRNYSIYAHGYQPIESNDSSKLKKLSGEVIESYLKLHNEGETLKTSADSFSFLKVQRASYQSL